VPGTKVYLLVNLVLGFSLGQETGDRSGYQHNKIKIKRGNE